MEGYLLKECLCITGTRGDVHAHATAVSIQFSGCAKDLPAQPEEGQRLINYLGVLEEKTAGNLAAEEAKILSTVLYQLRTFFLQSK